MVPLCAAPAPGAPLAASLADYLSCHAEGLGERGFQAFGGGFLLPALLSSCLIIYVALIGYRLMLGQVFGVRDAVFATLRIGLVITFCTSWPSYQAVVYRVVTEGPAELTNAILPSDLTAPSVPQIAAGLEGAYDVVLGAEADEAQAAASQQGALKQSAAQASIFPPNGNIAGATPQQSMARAAYVVGMVSSVGGLLALRFAAGLLLAIGPIVIALALFEAMVGFLEGWVRALGGVALGGAGVMTIAALQLSFVQAAFTQADPAGKVPTGEALMVLSTIFALLIVGVLISAAVVARGFKLPSHRLTWRSETPISAAQLAASASRTAIQAAPTFTDPPPSRAQAVSDAVTVQSQRERARTDIGASPSDPAPRRDIMVKSGGDNGLTSSQPAPLGYSLRRAPETRRSAPVARRESRR